MQSASFGEEKTISSGWGP